MSSPFYSGTALQYAWNSSSLGSFKSCAYKYYLEYIIGWRPKGSGFHIKFGSLYHEALERYDRQVLSGASFEDALDHVVDFLLVATWDSDTATPWETGDSKKNRYTLIRSVIWYIDHFANDPAPTLVLADGTPGLELKFAVELPFSTPKGDPYLLTGHLDRMVTYGSEVFISDRKTTGSTISPYFFDKFSPDNQMSLYTYVGQVAFALPISGIMIDAAQIAVGFTAFSRGFTTRSTGQLDEWLADTQIYIELAEQYTTAGRWPQNDKACFMCEFRKVCQKDPSVRENYLKTDFEIQTQQIERIME